MGLSPALGRGTIGIDSAVVIYFVERHPTFHPLARPLFVAAAQGERELATSSLTLFEVLTKPYQSGDLGRVQRVVTNDRRIPSVRWLPVVQLPDATT